MIVIQGLLILSFIASIEQRDIFDIYIHGFFNNYTMDVIPLDQIDPGEKCINCPRVYHPVCAYNNHTYTNVCMMRCANKFTGKSWMVNNPKKIRGKKYRYGPCTGFPSN